MLIGRLLKTSAVALVCAVVAGCGIGGTLLDPINQPATIAPPTKEGIVLDELPPPVQPLDVAVYAFPDLTGQNKENDNFAEFSRATTQGGADILNDVLTKAGDGKWFNVVERDDLQSLLQERQIIQNTRNAIYGKKAPSLPALRFAGVILDGGIVGFDTDETSGGIGANYLGIGGDVSYRQDIVTVALRAVSVQTGRVLASVTTTKTIYSVNIQGLGYKYVAVDKLLQAEAGVAKNMPVTIAVREGIQLAVYALIFEGARDGLWQFQNPAAGARFMSALNAYQRAQPADLPPPSPQETGSPVASLPPQPAAPSQDKRS